MGQSSGLATDRLDSRSMKGSTQKGIASDWRNIPVYRQVADHIRDRIRAGEFPPGGKLPTHDGLVKEYGVSMAIIRPAVDALRNEGWIRTVQGTGMFVAKPLPWKSKIK